MTTKTKALIYGAGSIFSVFGHAPGHEAGRRSDADALRSDWQRVGDDLRTAIYRYGEGR